MNLLILITSIFILGEYGRCWEYWPEKQQWNPEPVSIELCRGNS